MLSPPRVKVVAGLFKFASFHEYLATQNKTLSIKWFDLHVVIFVLNIVYYSLIVVVVSLQANAAIAMKVYIEIIFRLKHPLFIYANMG